MGFVDAYRWRGRRDRDVGLLLDRLGDYRHASECERLLRIGFQGFLLAMLAASRDYGTAVGLEAQIELATPGVRRRPRSTIGSSTGGGAGGGTSTAIPMRRIHGSAATERVLDVALLRWSRNEVRMLCRMCLAAWRREVAEEAALKLCENVHGNHCEGPCSKAEELARSAIRRAADAESFARLAEEAAGLFVSESRLRDHEECQLPAWARGCREPAPRPAPSASPERLVVVSPCSARPAEVAEAQTAAALLSPRVELRGQLRPARLEAHAADARRAPQAPSLREAPRPSPRALPREAARVQAVPRIFEAPRVYHAAQSDRGPRSPFSPLARAAVPGLAVAVVVGSPVASSRSMPPMSTKIQRL